MTGLGEILDAVHQRFAAARLSYGQGTENAWDEAVALVLGVTGLPDVQSSLQSPVSETDAAAIRELARRRVTERLPLAWLLETAPYCGEFFHVPAGVVVPRSPIGPLLADSLNAWIGAPKRILDLCCGSGCLGIIAAKRFAKARVLLADIDAVALRAARCNVERHGLEHRVSVMRSDLFTGLPRTPGIAAGSSQPAQSGSPRAADQGGAAEAVLPADAQPVAGFDLILCNPPYVDAETMAALPREFSREPARGLAGGSDGLAVINRVLAEAAGYLSANGVLVGEVGEGMGRLEARWPRVPFFWPDLPAGGAGVFVLRAADAP